MGTSQDEMKKAVECGYWHLYRYDPRRIAEGKNPFQLDSKEPDTDKVMDFLMGEKPFRLPQEQLPGQGRRPVREGGRGRQGPLRSLQEARETNLLQKACGIPFEA